MHFLSLNSVAEILERLEILIMANFYKTPRFLYNCFTLRTLVEEELHWEPLKGISDRGSRAGNESDSLVLIVRLNHDPYRC